MQERIQSVFRHITLLFIGIWLAGCAASLAPQYDQTILDGLNKANKDVQTLFATIGDGVNADSFNTRSASYIQAIGALNAIGIQARSRPTPDNKFLAEVNSVLTHANVKSIDAIEAFPSAKAAELASASLTVMKSADQKAGLRGDALKAFKNEINTYLSQAIAYETFLKR